MLQPEARKRNPAYQAQSRSLTWEPRLPQSTTLRQALPRNAQDLEQCWPCRGAVADSSGFLLRFANISRLRTFLPLHDLELHLIAFLQALVADGIDSAVVYEHIKTVFPPNESKTLVTVGPLYRSFLHDRTLSHSAKV
jgi:hypothetical protein